MPTYCFRCYQCSSLHEEVHDMASKPDTATCPRCGGEAQYDFAASLPKESSGDHWRDHWCEALAVHPTQVKERIEKDKRMNWQADSWDKHGRPKFSSEIQKRKYAEERGFHFNNSFL